jgi:hypothetical protein
VIDGLAVALIAVSLVLAVSAGLFALLDRLPPRVHLQGLLLLQLGLLLQAVVVLVRVGGFEGSLGELLGYLAVSVLLVPGGMVLALEERSRWGTAVLGAACFTVAVVVVRLLAVWSAGV